MPSLKKSNARSVWRSNISKKQKHAASDDTAFLLFLFFFEFSGIDLIETPYDLSGRDIEIIERGIQILIRFVDLFAALFKTLELYA